MTAPLFTLAGGFALLVVGGHYLVQGSVGIALLARISVTIVALTVVAMGTSAPELAVSLDAAARGVTDIAYGNIIGSCIFNIGAILGIAALLAPIPVRRETVRLEYPFMLGAAILTVALAANGVVGRVDGIVLVLGLVFFLSLMVWFATRGVPLADVGALEEDVRRTGKGESPASRAWLRHGAYVVIGMAALVAGADLSIAGGVRIARTLGVEERIIGLTVIAMGTSLPELVTCIVAAARRETEIALGNVVGSNIFNVLAILGITATIFPVPVHQRAIALDNLVMLGLSATLMPMMLFGRRITRGNALVLLAIFVSYIGYLIVAEA